MSKVDKMRTIIDKLDESMWGASYQSIQEVAEDLDEVLQSVGTSLYKNEIDSNRAYFQLKIDVSAIISAIKRSE